MWGASAHACRANLCHLAFPSSVEGQRGAFQMLPQSRRALSAKGSFHHAQVGQCSFDDSRWCVQRNPVICPVSVAIAVAQCQTTFGARGGSASAPIQDGRLTTIVPPTHSVYLCLFRRRSPRNLAPSNWRYWHSCSKFRICRVGWIKPLMAMCEPIGAIRPFVSGEGKVRAYFVLSVSAAGRTALFLVGTVDSI